MHAEYKLVICPQSYICNKNIIASSQEIISCSNVRKTIHAIIDKKIQSSRLQGWKRSMIREDSIS
jgi:hypothetical protein